MGSGGSVTEAVKVALKDSSSEDIEGILAKLDKGDLCKLAGCLASLAAEEEEVNIKFAQHNGNKIAYIVNGTGPKVVLILGSGLFQTKTGFRAMAAAFVAEGFRVIRFDSLGLGDSDKPLDKAQYSAEAFAGAAAAVLAAEEVAKAHVLAYDREGTLAVQMVKHHPTLIQSLTMGGHCPEISADGKNIMSGEEGYEKCKTLGMLPDNGEEYKPVALAHLEFANEVEGQENILIAVTFWGMKIMLYYGTLDDVTHAAGQAMAKRNEWLFSSVEGRDRVAAMEAPEAIAAILGFVTGIAGEDEGEEEVKMGHMRSAVVKK